MQYHRQHDWQPVQGETVQIRNKGRVVREGMVDAVTLDDSILWLAAEGNTPRQMACKNDGDEVWIIYRWETTETSNT
ncbi:hypothetical protein StoSoilA2_20520 [Arthrobacter sp. StoSoilA2]|nr:hypothetical protein StoSoilA2_20520 [Arthrobacter sp. StoSoilA2]